MNLFKSIWKWFSNTNTKQPIEKPIKLIVVESQLGYWSYHLAYDNNIHQALCGTKTMCCNLRLRQWGCRTHLNERYCEKCATIYNISIDNPFYRQGPNDMARTYEHY